MNIREQLMKKRIESLEGQIKVSIELLGRVLEENEYLASVACAVAWDYEAAHWEWVNGQPHFIYEATSLSYVWEQGMKGFEEAQLFGQV